MPESEAQKEALVAEAYVSKNKESPSRTLSEVCKNGQQIACVAKHIMLRRRITYAWICLSFDNKTYAIRMTTRRTRTWGKGEERKKEEKQRRI